MIFPKTKAHKYEFAAGLITVQKPESNVSEAYRALRTNIGFASGKHSCRTILFTSPNGSEGKSTVASNLAVVMAQANFKILLLDCNLRRPALHKMFNLSNGAGFTTYISQHISIDKLVTTGLGGNLSVITSGPVPPNPAEMLSSAETQSLWPGLQEKYDYVFIDAPALNSVTDAAVLSNQADGTILVIRPGHTRMNEARYARKQLNWANAHLIGVVLNKVKKNPATILR